MTICEHCQRPIKDSESACPFCSRPRKLSAAALAVAAGLALGPCDSNPFERRPAVYGGPPPPHDVQPKAPDAGQPIKRNQEDPLK